MRKLYVLALLALLTLPGYSQGNLLQAFKDDAEWHTDFATTNLEGWIINDLDGLNTAGPFQSFPGKGGPLGFIVYNPSQTNPANTMEAYIPKSGNKYFSSISSYDGAVNDWMITNELAPHTGGTFSFWAKAPFDFFGDEAMNVAYSMTGTAAADFTLLNASPISPPLTWQLYSYAIPAGAKHLAINCVSYAYFLMVDDVQFNYDLNEEAPGIITNFTSSMELGAQIVAHLNWTNPVNSISGGALADFTGVKIYRGTHPMNLVEIADVPSAAGQAMTYNDNLPESGFFLYRIEPYNSQGRGTHFDSPMTFFGYESTPAAPANITFTQNETLHTVISWSPVVTGEMGGELESPVTGYSIVRKLGTVNDTLATMHTTTSFTEADIPGLNIYTYTITALITPSQPGVPAITTAVSGLAADQHTVTSGNVEAKQPFELGRGSIISQSIYYADQIGSTGLITDITWFGNLGADHDAVYKVYMSNTDRTTFGENNTTAVWEYFGDQKLVFNDTMPFTAGLGPITITLDQPFYYDAASGDNVIVTIVKPLTTSTSSMYPANFMNTRVDGTRTYYAIGYATDMSIITTQPASWATEPVTTIPSIVTDKHTQFASVSGNVTVDGAALAEVTVTISPADGLAYQTETTLTSTEGAYNVPALLPGNYIITFNKETYNEYTETFTVTENQQLVINAAMVQAIPIVITGVVTNVAGAALEAATVTLTGFSADTAITAVDGAFEFNAFANKTYTVNATHPLYFSYNEEIISQATDFTLDTIALNLNALKPLNVVAVNSADTGIVTWYAPEGTYNETLIGWGSMTNTGNGWGDGGDEFIAAIRFETTDLATMVPQNGKLTHVKAYVSNYADIIIEVYEGANAAELIYSQPLSIIEEGWYTFELTRMIEVDPTKELWIGLHYQSGYGAYPIGIDEGPNAPLKKGSMLYSGGVWNQMSLTNKNWNIYGIINNTIEANPTAYQVLRKQTSETEWNLLSTLLPELRQYTDTSLATAPSGIYHYAVNAHYDNVASENSISNDVLLQMAFNLTIALEPDHGTAANTYIAVSNAEHFYETTVEAGQTSVTFNDVWLGDYQVYAQLSNYETVEMENVNVSTEQTIDVPLTLIKATPSNLKATLNGETALLQWTLHQTFTDKIETYPDFERNNISNYILRDLDGLETYTYTNFTWPDAGSPMSYMVFNPHATTPAVVMSTWSGRRMLSAFAGPDGVNNDWLIIPAGSGELSFMATSISTSGLEKFRVMYSTTGNETADFSQLGDVVTCPADWALYSYNLPEKTTYVAINYISNDTYFLLIDDITFEKEYTHALSYNVYLDGVSVAAGLTETNYELTDLAGGDHLVEVEAVYATGVSAKAQLNILGVDAENLTVDQFSIYPNPSNGIFHINLTKKATVTITDLTGKIVYTNNHRAGNNTINVDLPVGTYIIRSFNADGVTVGRLVIM